MSDFWKYISGPRSFEEKIKYLDDRIAWVNRLSEETGKSFHHMLYRYQDERARLANTIGKKKKS